MAVAFTVGFLSALLTPFLCIYEKVAKLGCYFQLVGACYMLVGLQTCREVIFQVIKGDS